MPRKGEGPHAITLHYHNLTMRYGSIYIPILWLVLLMIAVVSSVENLQAARRGGASRLAKEGVHQRVGTLTTVWDEETNESNLKFTIDDTNAPIRGAHKLFKKIRIRNGSSRGATCTITPRYRCETDNEYAVTLSTIFPGKVRIGAGLERRVTIVMSVQGDTKTGWNRSSGRRDVSSTLSVSLLCESCSGYLEIDDGIEPIKSSWSVVSKENSGCGKLASRLA